MVRGVRGRSSSYLISCEKAKQRSYSCGVVEKGPSWQIPQDIRKALSTQYYRDQKNLQILDVC